MTYPNSSDVASGQPTASAHYNNLRKDAIYLGNVAADSVGLASFLQSFVLNITFEYLATNRIRIPYDSQRPATIMISGCMLVQTANIDLPASSFSGAAATWYIFANRTAGVTSFTLTVNTSPVPGADQRLIGECYWNGSALAPGSLLSYSEGGDLRAPDYDSGWFACAYNNTYTKAHGLGQFPREVYLKFSTTNNESSVSVSPVIGYNTTSMTLVTYDANNIYVATQNNSSNGCCYSTSVKAGSGYYRIYAWV